MSKNKTILASLLTLACSHVALADPLLIHPDNPKIQWDDLGVAGTVNWADLTGNLVWISDQHLRTAAFIGPGDDWSPTTYHGETWLTETILSGLYYYTLDLRALLGLCDVHAQIDLEWLWRQGSYLIIGGLPTCKSSINNPEMGRPPVIVPVVYPPPPVTPKTPTDEPPTNEPPINEPPIVNPHIPPIPEPVPESNSLVLLAFGLCIVIALIIRKTNV